MTNAEKFEEVFGIKIDEDYPANPCDIFDHSICMNHDCDNECPAYNFWNREYKRGEDMTNEDLIKIAEEFNKWLDKTSKELHIDKDTLQEIIKQFLTW